MSTTLRLRIPGSSANLGPGFDTLGLALKIYNYFDFELLESGDWPIVVNNGTVEHLAEIENVALKLLSERLPPDMYKRLKLSSVGQVPLKSGLGSSGTAILAGLYASCYFTSRRVPEQHELLNEAARIEGHPDNVAASLLGGCVAAGSAGGNAICQKIRWPEEWDALIVQPAYTLSTEQARAVLPKSVDLQDAVRNLQNLALLVSGICSADERTVKESLHDFIHEPYRAKLVPELEILRKLLKNTPAMGCVLSGAGPCILVITHRRHKLELESTLRKWDSARGSAHTIISLEVDTGGLVQIG